MSLDSFNLHVKENTMSDLTKKTPLRELTTKECKEVNGAIAPIFWAAAIGVTLLLGGSTQQK